MAGCSKKQYAIMMGSGPEGQKLASKMGSMEQEEFNKAFAELLQSDSAADASYKAENSKWSKEEDEDYQDFDVTSEEDYGFDDEDNNDDKGEDTKIVSMAGQPVDEEKPLHIKSLENQVSRNSDYKAIADSLASDNKELNDKYFYAFKDAYEKNGYNPSNEQIESELEDAYWRMQDDFRDRRGLSETQFDRYGIDEFENKYGTLEDFVNKGIEAHNKYFDNLGPAGGSQPDIHEQTYMNARQSGKSPEEADKEANETYNKAKETENSDNLNPNNPKYKGFERSSITNAELVDEGYEFTDADTGEKRKESIISYIPYGSLQDGDNRRLYALVNNYDGTDTPKTGAIVAHSLEDAKEQLERQTQLGIQGRDRYLKRGQYDEDYFNLIRDNREPGDDEKYKERYGWDFNKPFAEHDFMKNEPYEKWKSDRIGNRKGKVGDRELSLNELIEKTNKLDDRELARDILAIQAPKFNLSEKEILEYYDKVGKK